MRFLRPECSLLLVFVQLVIQPKSAAQEILVLKVGKNDAAEIVGVDSIGDLLALAGYEPQKVPGNKIKRKATPDQDAENDSEAESPSAQLEQTTRLPQTTKPSRPRGRRRDTDSIQTTLPPMSPQEVNSGFLDPQQPTSADSSVTPSPSRLTRHRKRSDYLDVPATTAPAITATEGNKTNVKRYVDVSNQPNEYQFRLLSKYDIPPTNELKPRPFALTKPDEAFPIPERNVVGVASNENSQSDESYYSPARRQDLHRDQNSYVDTSNLRRPNRPSQYRGPTTTDADVNSGTTGVSTVSNWDSPAKRSNFAASSAESTEQTWRKPETSANAASEPLQTVWQLPANRRKFEHQNANVLPVAEAIWGRKKSSGATTPAVDPPTSVEASGETWTPRRSKQRATSGEVWSARRPKTDENSVTSSPRRSEEVWQKSAKNVSPRRRWKSEKIAAEKIPEATASDGSVTERPSSSESPYVGSTWYDQPQGRSTAVRHRDEGSSWSGSARGSPPTTSKYVIGDRTVEEEGPERKVAPGIQGSFRTGRAKYEESQDPSPSARLAATVIPGSQGSFRSGRAKVEESQDSSPSARFAATVVPGSQGSFRSGRAKYEESQESREDPPPSTRFADAVVPGSQGSFRTGRGKFEKSQDPSPSARLAATVAPGSQGSFRSGRAKYGESQESREDPPPSTRFADAVVPGSQGPFRSGRAKYGESQESREDPLPSTRLATVVVPEVQGSFRSGRAKYGESQESRGNPSATTRFVATVAPATRRYAVTEAGDDGEEIAVNRGRAASQTRGSLRTPARQSLPSEDANPPETTRARVNIASAAPVLQRQNYIANNEDNNEEEADESVQQSSVKGAEVGDADQDTASDDKHPHHEHQKKHEDKKFEEAEGGEDEEGHHEDHHEKGDKGYESVHEHDKAEKGHHDKESHSGHFDEKKGDKKSHEEEQGYHEEAHHGEEGDKEAEFGEKGEHNKGHSTKGQHFVHKKDEYEKKTEFFDEYHDDGDHEKEGGFHHEHENEKGGHEKKGHHDEEHHESKYGKGEKHAKGHEYHDHEGHDESEGHESHEEDLKKHGDKGGHEDGKKWAYKKGDDGGGGKKERR